jgi:hypothetical protein
MKIVIHFKGGLGNQLIQYAFVQKYFGQKNVEVIFDTTHFKLLRERQFFLGDFPHASPSKIRKAFLLFHMYCFILISRISKVKPFSFLRHSLGNYIDDDMDVAKIAVIKNKTIYVNGYFQHLELFPFYPGNPFYSFLEKLSGNLSGNVTFQLIQKSPNPIMLHLRRGDYVQNETVKKIMGTCGIGYFRKGIEKVYPESADYTLFVFSDDLDYAKKMFAELDPVYFVEGDAANPIHDFLLMRCFKYAVISNSTLSYMANMFSTHEENVVVMPRPWFNNGMQFRLGTKEKWSYVDKA